MMTSTCKLVGRWILIVILILGVKKGLAVDLGPLQTVNRLPLHLMFLTPRPTRAGLPARGDLETSLAVEYASVFLEQSTRRWNILMDMEMTLVDLSLAYGAGDKLALRIDLPFASMTAGFLDGFLENYHDALGAPNYGRDNRPADTFGYQISKDGAIWFQGQDGSLRLADMTVSAQLELTKSMAGTYHSTSSLLFSLKLPTGDADIGLGSGAMDVGVFVPMQWSATPWSFYFMPGAAWINDPESRQADISARNSFSLFAGTGYDYNDRLRLLAQIGFHTSPLESTDSSWLDNGALELSVGFQRKFGDALAWEFAFSEDLSRAAPDFNLRTGIIWATTIAGPDRR